MRKKIGPYLDDSITNIQQVLNETVFNATIDSKRNRKSSDYQPPSATKLLVAQKIKALVQEKRQDSLIGHKNIRLSKNAYVKITKPGNAVRVKSTQPIGI